MLSARGDRWPEFADSLRHDLSPEYFAREAQELLLADCVLAPWAVVRRAVEGLGVPPDRIADVPFGVDLKTFAPGPRKPNDTFRVLFVGKLTQRKGLAQLLEAFRRLRLPGAQLEIVGNLVGYWPLAAALQGHFRVASGGSTRRACRAVSPGRRVRAALVARRFGAGHLRSARFRPSDHHDSSNGIGRARRRGGFPGSGRRDRTARRKAAGAFSESRATKGHGYPRTATSGGVFLGGVRRTAGAAVRRRASPRRRARLRGGSRSSARRKDGSRWRNCNAFLVCRIGMPCGLFIRLPRRLPLLRQRGRARRLEGLQRISSRHRRQLVLTWSLRTVDSFGQIRCPADDQIAALYPSNYSPHHRGAIFAPRRGVGAILRRIAVLRTPSGSAARESHVVHSVRAAFLMWAAARGHLSGRW